MAELKAAYERLCSVREPYLNQARLNSRWTIDVGLWDDVQVEAQSGESDPQNDSDMLLSTSINKTLVKNLGATQTSVLVPVRVPWVILDLDWDDELRREATAHKVTLARGQRSILKRFDRMGVRSAFYTASLHAAVASGCIMHFRAKDKLGPDRCRLFGLNQFVIEWQDQWLKRCIVQECEEIHDDSADNKQSTKKYWWTEINFQTGKIRQEKDDKIKSIRDDRARRWVFVANEQPHPGRQYPNAYVTNHIHTIIELDTLHRAYQDLVGEAAILIIATRSGSGVTAQALSDMIAEGGPIILPVNDPTDINFITAQGKLTDAMMVHDRIEKLEAQLRKDFLHGVLTGKRLETATEVREIVDEQQSIGAQFYAYHQDHTMLPIAEALLDFETNGGDIELGDRKIRPTILTGVSALTQQEEAEALMNIMVQLGQIYPEEIRSLPFISLFKRLAAPFHIETEDLTGEGAEAMDLLKQLALKARENPDEVMPLIKELIANMPGLQPNTTNQPGAEAAVPVAA